MKNLVEIVQSIVTTIAILIGGGWALYEFGIKRVSQPRLTIDHSIISEKLTQEYRWLHLSVVHENRGDSLVRISSSDIRLQRILPLPRFVGQTLSEGTDPIREGEFVVRWPLLCRTKADYQFELEPNEIQEMTFEFLIPASVEKVKVYTYFPNAAKDAKIGWSKTTIYDIRDEGGASHAAPAVAQEGNVAHVCARES